MRYIKDKEILKKDFAKITPQKVIYNCIYSPIVSGNLPGGSLTLSGGKIDILKCITGNFVPQFSFNGLLPGLR